MSATGLHAGWRIGTAGAAWLAGTALQLQQPALWPWPAYPAVCAAGLAMLLAALALQRRRPTASLGWLLGLAALFALALGSAGWRAEQRLAQRLAPRLEGVDLWVTGVVASLPQQGPSGLRFNFEVEAAEASGLAVRLPPLLALGWYAGYDDSAWLDEPRADLRAGQRWRLPLRLKRPHGVLNPQGYDAELSWFEQGIGATGQVRELRGAPAAALLADAVAYPVDRLRGALRDAIYRQVPDVRTAGVLAALVVGDQNAIDRSDWDLFRQTGIAHLVSISGVHVTMFAWIAGTLVGWAWRRHPGCVLALPAPQAARWGGLLLAAAYALLAGWGVPAQRTVLMLAATVLMRAAGLRWPWLLVLMAAAVAVTALDPWALLQAGFWLSFAAVAMLMLSEPAGGRAPGAGWRALAGGHLRAQVVATLGLAPLSLVFFGQLSLVGFAANLVAIPLVTLLVTPLALLGALWAPLWTVAGWGVQALVALLAQLAAWPLAMWSAAAAPGWAVGCGLLAAMLAVMPLPWTLRWLALPLALPLLLPPLPRPADGQFELLAADVGQGTAVLVRTRAHLLVYDSGPQYGRAGEGDAGQRVLLPLLRARGETRIDRLVLSHRDADHVGGAAALMAALPVATLFSSLEPGHALRSVGVPHSRCEAGQRWSWDGVAFELLHPLADDYARAPRPNALSCVLRVVDAQGRSALLTGDIEAAQEAGLLLRHGDGLRSNVLLVPHHGSRTSSTGRFIDAVAPEVAVVQSGYRSRYGHPAPDIVRRYLQRGVVVARSDDCGAWRWSDGVGECTRTLARRYWHAGAASGR